MRADGHQAPDHRLERLMFFSDAVFAIAITLLVIEIHLPPISVVNGEPQWGEALLHLVPHFFAFALSFLVIGATWASHHTLFSLLAGFDPKLVWANLFLLLAVIFLPFSTSLLAVAGHASTPYAFYAATLLAAALFKARLTYLALQGPLIAPGVSAERVKIELRRAWIMPAATLLTLLLAFPLPIWNNLAMFLLPIARRLPGLRLPEENAPVAENAIAAS